ncbi:MAG: hypothetical protein HC801_08760, partial [Nitrospira sp.]|nr:hypothetical protein [Nitrospira sp.]
EAQARRWARPVQEKNLSDPTTCLFKAHRHAGNTVTVQVNESVGKDQRVSFNKERLGRDSRLIPGLGDGAFRIDSSPTLSRLTFMHKDALVTVIVASTKQKHLDESVTLLSQFVAARYGATSTTTLPPMASSPAAGEAASAHLVSRPTPVALTQTLPGPSDTQTGPQKAPSIDPTGLIGTWHTRSTQGTTQHDMLLVIKPNLQWSLSSMMQFDGVVNAEGGLWLLERANTFKGLGWKGSYRKRRQTHLPAPAASRPRGHDSRPMQTQHAFQQNSGNCDAMQPVYRCSKSKPSIPI